MLIGRAVLAEVTRNFLGALAASTGLVFFMMALAFMKKAPGVGLGVLLEIFPVFFPLALQFTVPMSALISVVLTFSRMQADRELTALSASGVTLFSVVWPVLAGAALVSLASLLLIDQAAPYAAGQLRDAQRDIAQEMQTSFRSGLRDINLNRARVSFESYDRGQFRDVLIEVKQRNGRANLFRALGGSLEITDDDRARFLFTPLHALMPKERDHGRTFGSVQAIAGQFHLDESTFRGGPTRKRTDLDAQELAYASARELPKKYARVDGLDAAEELARRSALAGSVFFFALAGISLGILAGNKAKVAGVITACAPIIVIYFPLVIAGSNLARTGALPVYPSLWMGNVVLLIGGGGLLYRVARR
ncbi:MAG: LptF/LptG family permease [Planctomycetota bacterium]|jgi:lipopolysaccharide export system permease protein